MRFWRDGSSASSRDHNGGPPHGQVRVLVVGDSGLNLFFTFPFLLFGYQCFKLEITTNFDSKIYILLVRIAVVPSYQLPVD